VTTQVHAWGEIFAVKLDGSQTVERFTHRHSIRLEPHTAPSQAYPNPNGTEVLFASYWGRQHGDTVHV
jgi:hypothetical protein